MKHFFSLHHLIGQFALSLALTLLLTPLAYCQQIQWPDSPDGISMVFQRDNSNKATIKFVASSANNATTTACLVRYRKYALNGSYATGYIDPRPGSNSLDGNGYLNGVSFNGLNQSCQISFQFDLTGGMYQMELSINGATTTREFGVGEVFAIAGQSNAAGLVGSGELSFGNTKFVQFNNEKSDKDSNDPGGQAYPSNKYFKYYWGNLGSQLASNLNVPIAFYQNAWSGTSIVEWHQSRDGVSSTTCGNTQGVRFRNGYPYRNLKEFLTSRARQTGVRAVLWHQGENDNSNSGFCNIGGGNYNDLLNQVIEQSRADVSGQDVAWVIARASYNNGSVDAHKPYTIINAQDRVLTRMGDSNLFNAKAPGDPAQTVYSKNNIFTGPNTDLIIGPANRIDQTHFNLTGEQATANAWYTSLTQNYGSSNFFSNSNPTLNNQTVSVPTPSCTTNPVACNFSSPIAIGTWNGYNVQLMNFDGNKVLVTVVPGGPNGAVKYFARGKNYWNSVSRNSNTDQYYNCINVGDTGYGGLVLPFSSTYTPSGYSKGTESDGAIYYYQGGGCPSMPNITGSPGSVNPGGQSTLTATNCSGIVHWSTGQTGSAINVYPTTTTTYLAYCEANGCNSSNTAFTVSVQANPSSDPCDLSTPKTIGSWNGYTVQLMQFDSYKALATVVPGGPGGAVKYFARGKNYWNSISRNANTDQYYNCINVGDTGYGGLVLPFNTTYTPSGYSKGTESDGAVYYYRVGGGRVGVAGDEITGEGILSLVISPNPNKGIFKVSTYTAPQQSANLVVTDIQGKTWFEKSFSGEGYQIHNVHLSPQASGTFIVSLYVNGKVISKKLIVN